MTRFLLSMTVLVVMSLACAVPVGAPPTPSLIPATPTRRAVPSATAESGSIDTLTIQAVVYIRAEADANSDDVGSLQTGAEVELRGECSEAWCPVRVMIDGKPVDGWVFRGCTSDPNGLLCEAR
jgi:hypothetical protein